MNFAPRTSRSRPRGRIGRMEITPMIDVIFLLLIYFFLSTTYEPPESELAPALKAERVEGGSGADLQPQIVEVGLVGGEPGFRIGSRVTRDQDALRELLEGLPKEAGVFVRGEPGAGVGWAAAALQAARDAGFDRVTYVPMR